MLRRRVKSMPGKLVGKEENPGKLQGRAQPSPIVHSKMIRSRGDSVCCGGITSDQEQGQRDSISRESTTRASRRHKRRLRWTPEVIGHLCTATGTVESREKADERSWEMQDVKEDPEVHQVAGLWGRNARRRKGCKAAHVLQADVG
jgi:hypothetical protein